MVSAQFIKIGTPSFREYYVLDENGQYTTETLEDYEQRLREEEIGKSLLLNKCLFNEKNIKLHEKVTQITLNK